MKIQPYTARVPYRREYIPYKHKQTISATLGIDLDLPIRCFDGEEAPVVLRFSPVGNPLSADFRVVDGRLFMPMQTFRNIDDVATADFVREADLPTLLGLGRATVVDNPLLRPGMHHRETENLSTFEQKKAEEAVKGERSRWGGGDHEKSIEHARRNAEALILVDGIVHHRTPEPVWIVAGNTVRPVLGRALEKENKKETYTSWHIGEYHHLGFPALGEEHREAFCRQILGAVSPTTQYFQADRFDDAVAYASVFGEVDVQGAIDIVAPPPLHLPQFATYAASMVESIERGLRADDFRVFNRRRLMDYADLRDAVKALRTGERGALYPAFEALAAMEFGIEPPQTGKYKPWGDWILPARALVGRWNTETARPEFELYPEENLRADAPDLAIMGPSS